MNSTTTEPYSNPAARDWRIARSPEVIGFHRSMPGYAPTRLVEVSDLAAELGVARLFVKEESARFGLPAFKVLGASYAICRTLSERCGIKDRALPVGELRALLSAGDSVELVAATDGNHGRAVAYTARLLGLRSHIFLPSSITDEAKAGIAAEGARVEELSAPYDDIVATAAEAAARDDAVLVQDTSWEGYEQIPQWIVDGYSTVMVEVDAQLAELSVAGPDLVAVPVGVGSFAEAVVRHYRSGTSTGAPSVLSVEPTAAPAVITSLAAGRLTSVPTSATIMAGLNCGTPSATSWPILQAGIDTAVTVSDAEASAAVRVLAAHGVDSGPCGASTLAGVRSLREAGALPPEATVLLLSTEGRRANPLPRQMA